ncbi:hypothetical protein ACQEVI_04665 [Promicromonospora sp. CA-289599]|uniref:hypothetical protein n=1 Tax=Promicromonospora sp. CA-289599 TaxID=3240014 RepID=UPI003D8F0545
MSSTYGGWNPQDPNRGQDPEPWRAQPPQVPQQQTQPSQQGQPQPAQPSQPQPFDPYGPRDPYGRPANPYGRPDYQPLRRPEQQEPQPQQPAPPQRYQEPPAQPGPPQYPTASGTERRPDADGPTTIGNAWRWAWSAFGASWGVWVLMSLLLGLAQVAVLLAFSPSTMAALANSTDPAAVDAALAAGRTLEARGLAAAGTAVGFLLQALLYAGALAATRTRKVRIRDFFVLRGFGGLVGFAVVAGALGFAGTAVPTAGVLVQVVVTLVLVPVPFLLLGGVGFGRAFVRGIGLVLSHLGTAFGVFGIFAGLVIASIPTCGIGLVVVVPAMLLVGAYLVQRWTGETVQG